MVGWRRRINGHEFEQMLGDGDGLGGQGCCSPWGQKESRTTERLSNLHREVVSLEGARGGGQGTREGMERSLKPRRGSQGRRAGDAGGRGQKPEAKEREWVPEPSK